MLKQSTKALLESFRYRRIAYSGTTTIRDIIARKLRQDIADLGSDAVRDSEIVSTSYRKHLATLHSMERGLNGVGPGQDAIYSLDLSPHQFDDEQPRSLERFHLDDDTGPEQPYLGEIE